jgi:hypothetical protein
MFKSAEEREAERRRKQEQADAAEAARARADRVAEEERLRTEFLATPLGEATTAKEAGQEFLEIQLEVGGVGGSAAFGMATGSRETASSAETLAEIEQLGWRLEHANYLYLITGETSSARILGSGEATAVTGVVVGVYLFRNVRDTPA